MRIVSLSEMREIEDEMKEKFHLSENTIIENVGRGVSEFLDKNYSSKEITYLFIVGYGNNGADGMCAARYLSNMGYNVRVFLFGDESKKTAAFNTQMSIAESFEVKGNRVESADSVESFILQTNGECIIIDCLFGTGVRLPLADELYELIQVINDRSDFTISLDIPTGVETDTGAVEGSAVRADLTLSVGFPKIGCFQGEGVNYVGKLENIDIGIPRQLRDGDKVLADIGDIIHTARLRSKFADKRFFGHTLLLGGSHGKTGSLVLSSEAALRVGAGLATGATWEPQYLEFTSRLIPEIKTGFIPTEDTKWDNLIHGLSNYDSIVIGPGLGVNARSRRVVHKILESYQGPMVVDADAINVLDIEQDAVLLQNRLNPTILTPHCGEMASFFNVKEKEVQDNPISYLKKAIELTNAFVILKGPCTYLGFPSGKIYLNYSPNAGMATGGVGDVLAGILGGLIAQDNTIKKNVSKFDKLVSLDKTILLSVVLHSRAGHFASMNLGERYMSAKSIIDSLPKAFEEIKNYG